MSASSPGRLSPEASSASAHPPVQAARAGRAEAHRGSTRRTSACDAPGSYLVRRAGGRTSGRDDRSRPSPGIDRAGAAEAPLASSSVTAARVARDRSARPRRRGDPEDARRPAPGGARAAFRSPRARPADAEAGARVTSPRSPRGPREPALRRRGRRMHLADVERVPHRLVEEHADERVRSCGPSAQARRRIPLPRRAGDRAARCAPKSLVLQRLQDARPMPCARWSGLRLRDSRARHPLRAFDAPCAPGCSKAARAYRRRLPWQVIQYEGPGGAYPASDCYLGGEQARAGLRRYAVGSEPQALRESGPFERR